MHNGGAVQVQWSASANHSCRVLGSDDLVNWQPLTDWQFVGRTGARSLGVAAPTNVSARFFRLEVKP